MCKQHFLLWVSNQQLPSEEEGTLNKKNKSLHKKVLHMWWISASSLLTTWYSTDAHKLTTSAHKKITQRWLKFSNFRLQNLKVALIISRFQVVHICQGQMKFSISKDSLSAPRANRIPLLLSLPFLFQWKLGSFIELGSRKSQRSQETGIWWENNLIKGAKWSAEFQTIFWSYLFGFLLLSLLTTKSAYDNFIKSLRN